MSKDSFNDETFASGNDISGDFDFSLSNQKFLRDTKNMNKTNSSSGSGGTGKRPPPGLAGPDMSAMGASMGTSLPVMTPEPVLVKKKFMTLEEVEASMKKNESNSNSSNNNNNNNNNTNYNNQINDDNDDQKGQIPKLGGRNFPVKAATLEEIEASLKKQSLNEKDNNENEVKNNDSDKKLMEEENEKETNVKERVLEPLPSSFLIPLEGGENEVALEANERKRFDDPYRGIMSKEEKSLISRILLSQLASDKPHLDDFYYQAFIKRKQIKSENTLYLPLPQLSSTNSNRKNGNKAKVPADLSLQGALGKIAAHSVRNPRQLLKVEKSSSKSSRNASESGPTSTMDSATNKALNQKLLRTIETSYTRIYHMEDLKERDIELPVAARKENQEERETLTLSIVKDFMIETVVTNEPNAPFFIRALRHTKAKQLVKRLIPFLSFSQKDILFQSIIQNFEHLDVVGPSASTQETELFISSILSPMVSFVADCVPQLVLDWMTCLLGKSHHFLKIVASKVGLVLLCILLSRADIVKGQEEQSMPMDLEEEEDETEAEEPSEFAKSLGILINRLYECLCGSFLEIFPAPSESAFYVWQFLALLVNNISMEQRHALVVEVREKVLMTVSSGNETWIGDLNIFLNAMGLDASQLIQ